MDTQFTEQETRDMRNEAEIKANIAAELEAVDEYFGKKPPKKYPDHVRPEVRAVWNKPRVEILSRQQRRHAERMAAKRAA